MIIVLLMLLVLIFKHKISINEFSFKIYHILALIYLLVLIISTLLSPYKEYNLLIGSPRMEGLIVNIIYILSFLFISLTYKFNKKILDIIIIPSIIIGIIIIIQYIGFNPLYLYKMGGSNIFYGTIGNIDIIGLLYIMYVIFMLFRYIFSDINKLLYLLSFFISMLVFFIINVDAAYFTFFIALLFLLPIVLLKSKYLKKYLDIIIIISIASIFIINVYIIILLFIFVIIRLLINNLEYNVINKKNIIIGYMCLLLLLIMGLIVLYFYKFNITILSDVYSILHFKLDDSLGSYRMFLWKRTINMFNNNILFGTGCDTFYIRFMNLYIDDVKSIGRVDINDSACNIYLTMLINRGLVGLLLFISFIYSVLIKIKNNFNFIILVILMTIILLNIWLF